MVWLYVNCKHCRILHLWVSSLLTCYCRVGPMLMRWEKGYRHFLPQGCPDFTLMYTEFNNTVQRQLDRALVYSPAPFALLCLRALWSYKVISSYCTLSVFIHATERFSVCTSNRSEASVSAVAPVFYVCLSFRLTDRSVGGGGPIFHQIVLVRVFALFTLFVTVSSCVQLNHLLLFIRCGSRPE